MNVASLGISWLLPQAVNTLSSIAGSTGLIKQTQSTAGNVSGNNNSDGDTFELSLSSAMMPNAAKETQAGANTLGEDIANFLTKIEKGTATSDDLQSMQNELQQAQQSGTTGLSGHHHHHHHAAGAVSNSQDTTASSVSSDLSSFLDKVAQGTATDSDLTTIESEMATLSNQQSVSTSSTQSTAAGTVSNVQKSNIVARAFLDSAMNAYNTQAYFGSNTAAQV